MATKKVTAAQVESVANALGSVAAMFNPAAGATIIGLVKAATKLNTMVAAVREQTGETAKATWDKVSADYTESLNAFAASVAAQQQQPGGGPKPQR